MPRLRPPRSTDQPVVVEDFEMPTEDIVIDLSADGEVIDHVTNPAEPNEPAPAAAPAVVTKKVEEDDALQKAVEATQRAEELARTMQRERDEALRRENERAEELTRERGEREDAQYNSVLTALAAAQAAVEKAEADYAQAASIGDWAAAAKAQSANAIASARLDRLEDSKATFDTRRETARTNPPPERMVTKVPQDFEQKLAALQVPDTAKTWLRNHPEFVNDTGRNDSLNGTHQYLTKTKGMVPFSQAYFDALDTEFGFKPAEPHSPTQHSPQRRSLPVSAPVSRDIPSANGTRSSASMTLTAEERKIARSSFTDPTGKMTNAEKEYLYAQNKAKLLRMRANGQYPTREQG